MDIRIEKKKGIRALFTKKGIPYLAGALFLVFVLWLLLRDNSSTLRVDARTISVGQVVRGEFNDYIRVTGQVQPITTVQLSPLEAGIVERLVVEEGTSVKKGDVLVVLSNTSLTLEILNSEAELAEKQNILRNTLISMEQEKLSLRQDKAQLDLDVSRKKRAWQQNEELYRNALIAREEWLQSKEDYELAEKKRELNIERQVQDSLYRSVQIEQMEENLDNMKRNMQLIRERIGNLNVKSPIDGEVGLLDIVENRLVGMKDRGVYETPGGTILYKAHQCLEMITIDKDTAHMKSKLAVDFADLVYNGKWFTPLREALSAFADKTQEHVTGSVKLKLYKGNMITASITSPESLYSEELVTFNESSYDQTNATGFINLWGLPDTVLALREQGKL